MYKRFLYLGVLKPIRLTFALSSDVVSAISISTHLPPGTPRSCGILPPINSEVVCACQTRSRPSRIASGHCSHSLVILGTSDMPLSLSYWTLIASRLSSSRRRGVSSGASSEWGLAAGLPFQLELMWTAEGEKHRCCYVHTHTLRLEQAQTHTHRAMHSHLHRFLRRTVKNKYRSLRDSNMK